MKALRAAESVTAWSWGQLYTGPRRLALHVHHQDSRDPQAVSLLLHGHKTDDFTRMMPPRSRDMFSQHKGFPDATGKKAHAFRGCNQRQGLMHILTKPPRYWFRTRTRQQGALLGPANAVLHANSTNVPATGPMGFTALHLGRRRLNTKLRTRHYII